MEIKSQVFFLFICICYLFHVVLTQEETEFVIGTAKVENFPSSTHYYRVNLLQPIGEYLVIEAEPLDKENGFESNLFVSKVESRPSIRNSDYKSALKGADVIAIPKEYFENASRFYVGIECIKECKYKIKMEYLGFLPITEGQTLYYTTDTLQNTRVYRFNQPEGYKKKYIFYTLAGHVEDLSMKVEYVYGKDKRGEVPHQQAWYNGYAAVVLSDEYLYCAECYFRVEVISKTKSSVAVGMKVLNTALPIELTEKAFMYLEKDDKNCFQIIDNQKTDSEKQHYLLSLQSYFQNVKMYIATAYESTVEIKTWEIKDSLTIILQYEDIKDKLLCFKTDSPASTAYSLQVVRKDELEKSQPENMPLVNGIPIFTLLPAGKVNAYRHWKYEPTSKSLNMNLKAIKGDPKLYGYICTTYPDCIFNKEKVETYAKIGDLYKAQNLNDDYHISIPNEILACKGILDEYCQILALVSCSGDKDCEYMINMSTDKDYIVFTRRMEISKFILEGEDDDFRIKITDPTLARMTITLDSLNGDADLSSSRRIDLDDKTGKYSSVGNREIVEYINTDKEHNSLLGDYFIKVKGISNAYYRIYYSSSMESSEEETKILDSGIISVETLSKKNPVKTFIFSNRQINEDAPYVVTFYSVNCEVEVSQGDIVLQSKDSHAQYIVTKEDPLYNKQLYPFKVKLLKIDSGSDTDWDQCMIYMGGNEIIQNRDWILNEGNSHYVTLKPDVKRISYIYPHIFTGEPIATTISVNEKVKLKVSFGIDDKFLEEDSYVISKSRKLILSSDRIETAKCKTKICSIQIRVEADDTTTIPGDGVMYSILVKSNNKVPVYLDKNDIHSDSVFPKAVQYYYTDIKKDEVGEVILTVKRGSGIIFAKIVRKDARPEANADWQKRVRLPVPTSLELLPYDHFNRKITYDSSHTKDCANGCELYVGVMSTEKSQARVYLTEYTITVKNAILNLPINEVAYGSLNTTMSMKEFGYDHYTFTVHNEADRVMVQLSSSYCVLFANLGNEPPTKDKHHWKFSNKAGFMIINRNDPLITDNTLKGKTFTFSVASEGLDDILTSSYSIMATSIAEKADPIIEINSDDNFICDIQTDNGYCDFVIPIHAIDQIPRILLYAFPKWGIQNSFKIYANLIISSVYDTLTQEQIMAKRPRNGASEYSSDKQFNSEYLLIESERLMNEIYVMVSVEGERKGLVSFLASSRTDVDMMTLSPVTQKLVHLKKNQQIFFTISGKGNYEIEISRIFGKATVSYSNEKEYKIDEQVTNLGIVNRENQQLFMTAVEEFGFYISYDIRPEENLDYVSYGNYNYMVYPHNAYPVMYYCPVENEEMDVTVNFKIYQSSANIHDPGYGDDDFVIYGFFTNDEFIQARKRDKNAINIFKKFIQGEYDPSVKVGKLTYYSADIKDYTSTSKKMLLILVDRKGTNKLNYQSFMTQFIAYPIKSMQSKLTLPQYHYFYSSISGKPQDLKLPNYDPVTALGHVYRLGKKNPKENIMLIELASCSDDVHWAIRPYQEGISDIDPIVYQNSTDVNIIKENHNHGKLTLQVQLPEKANDLIFSVFTKNKNCDTKLLQDCAGPYLSFALKYKSSPETFMTFFLGKDGNVEWERKEKDVPISFGSIIDNNLNVPIAAQYMVRVLTRQGIKYTGELNSICLLNNPVKIYRKQSDTTKDVKMTLENFPEGEMFVSVIASTDSYFDVGTLFAYNHFQIGQHEEPVLKKSIWWIIVLLVLVSIVFLILLIYFYRKYRQMKLKMEYESNSLLGPATKDKEDKQKPLSKYGPLNDH